MHIVVTGASSGIGEAIARRYHGLGAKVTLVARREKLLAKLAEELGDGSCYVVADLLDLERVPEVWARCLETFGPVDVLVNNAGMQVVTKYEDGELMRYDRSIALNLQAPMHLIHSVLPSMLERGSGTIVNVASLAALAPTPYMASYNASKAGLAAMSEALRGELLGTGVNVVTVYPGPVKTAMADAALEVYNAGAANALPTGTTEELACRIESAVKKRGARLVYPRLYYSAKWFPGITRFVMDRMTPSLRK